MHPVKHASCRTPVPATRNGPVAGFTKGRRTVSAESLEAVEMIRPSLQLISHSTVTSSPGRTSAMQASVAESAYFRWPAFGMVWVVSFVVSSRWWKSVEVVPPRQQRPLDPAHNRRE